MNIDKFKEYIDSIVGEEFCLAASNVKFYCKIFLFSCCIKLFSQVGGLQKLQNSNTNKKIEIL